MLFTHQLILVLLSQLLCSAGATDDVSSPPIRKRSQRRVLRGGSTRENDFDPFIGIEVARELSSTGRIMSMLERVIQPKHYGAGKTGLKVLGDTCHKLSK